MPKLPLRELEEARSNPVAYRRKLNGPPNSIYRYSYFNALRDSIFEMHRPRGTVNQARRSLEHRLSTFKDQRKIQRALDNFDWYAGEYQSRQWPTFRTRMNIAVQLPAGISGLTCSGQIGRIDIVPSGGYAAWLLRNGTDESWDSELQMPLIQETLAGLIRTPVQDVSVGIYAFETHQVELRVFSAREILRARRGLEQLVRSLGY